MFKEATRMDTIRACEAMKMKQAPLVMNRWQLLNSIICGISGAIIAVVAWLAFTFYQPPTLPGEGHDFGPATRPLPRPAAILEDGR